jgi:hypothetical protein
MRQVAACQRDDHGVVAAQEDVDPDDLKEGNKKLLVQSYVHVVSSRSRPLRADCPYRPKGRCFLICHTV